MSTTAGAAQIAPIAQTAEPPVGAAQIAPITHWTASSSTGLALREVSVPGDLISDLERNDIIVDPLYERTFLEGEPLWNEPTWTYKATFAGSAAARLLRATTTGQARTPPRLGRRARCTRHAARRRNGGCA